MATMNISLPDSLKEWAEAQVAAGKFANMSDFIRDLLREQRDKQRYIAYVSEALEEAQASGYVPLDTNELRRELGLNDESDAA